MVTLLKIAGLLVEDALLCASARPTPPCPAPACCPDRRRGPMDIPSIALAGFDFS